MLRIMEGNGAFPDRVKVRVRLDESNVQRRRIALDLIEPSTLPGLSVDFDLSESIGVGI